MATIALRNADHVGQKRDRKTLEALTAEFGLTKIELMSICVKAVLDGNNFEQAARLIKNEHFIVLNRFQARDFFLAACRANYVQSAFPLDVTLANRIRGHHPGLERARVVQAADLKSVAKVAAETLFGMMRDHNRSAPRKDEIHIGVAGGPMTSEICRLLSKRLQFDCDGFPSTVIFHSLYGGDDPADTNTDPNAYFKYFKSDGSLGVSVQWIRFLSAPDVPKENYLNSRRSVAVAKAFERKAELDIVVTSASCPKGHGAFERIAAPTTEERQRLIAAGYLGDLMGCPMGPQGPLDIEMSTKIMMLMEANELPAFIASRKKVLLAVGACSRCHATKEPIVQVVLDQPRDRQLVTHVVLDSRTARRLTLSQ